MTSSESSQEWKGKERKSPPRETERERERGRKWRDVKEKGCSVGVNSGVVDGRQCEILSLDVQGIMPVKE